jgi:cytosine/adenosine deaminase-related metal-dependent hydrolase
MSAPIDDGGPAFPLGEYENIDQCNGMSLRDWFAGQALAGHIATLSNPVNIEALLVISRNRGVPFTLHIAQMSYEIADAMLKARNKEVAQ